jgi:predicted RNA methylase
MFNKNFYPTSKKTIIKMVSGLNRKMESHRPRILEPSAGKGDILDYLKEFSCRYNLFCIEKDPELAHILRDKGYKFLDDDFLTYVPDCTFDAIIMNPPFDQGAKHFLKAWEISSNTHIRCLLNEETILNPRTEERKLIKKIIKDNKGEYESLGPCFIDAERKTKVNVILVSIYKKERNEHNFTFTKQFDQEKQYDVYDLQKNEIANIDVFGNLETRYNKVREGIAKMIKIKNEIVHYGFDIVGSDVFSLFKNESDSSDMGSYNNICDEVRKQAWNTLFSNTKMCNVVTTKTRKKIHKQQEQQGHMSFTAKNMENLYSDLFQNMGNIMQDCIVESFDLLTKYWEENRCYIEGWKTNKRFYVNKKFILPRSVDIMFSDYGYISMHYERRNDLDDIEKALCFLTGQKLEDIRTISEQFSHKEIKLWGKWHDSTFFEFKCFKKGTMHFKFKSEDLWNKFNVAACKGKNWLGC